MIMLPTIVYISVFFSVLLLKWALHIQICKISLKREVATRVLQVIGGIKALVTKVIQRVSGRRRRSKALTPAQSLLVEK